MNFGCLDDAKNCDTERIRTYQGNIFSDESKLCDTPAILVCYYQCELVLEYVLTSTLMYWECFNQDYDKSLSRSHVSNAACEDVSGCVHVWSP